MKEKSTFRRNANDGLTHTSNINGITLVALVVTIVILLILAGITITYVLGDNGIIKLAQKAKDETENAIRNEQKDLEEMINMLKNEYSNGEGSGGENGDNTEGNTTNPPVEPETPIQPNPEKPTIVGAVDKIQDTTTTVEDANGNKVVVPGGFKIVPDTNDNDVDYTYSGDKTPCVQDGVVIEDQYGNQFVWVPVGEIENKDGSITTITLGRYTFDTTNGTPTLKQNADDYSSKTITVASYYQELLKDSGNTAAKELGTFVRKTKENNGYYLARYEASRGEYGSTRVQSKYDKEAWANITQPEAAAVARGVYSDNYVESDLVNSYAWDTAIVFIQKYSENSNYSNKKSVNINKLNTGKAGDKVCNIHDMASNCAEWSTEHSTRKNGDFLFPYVLRGGEGPLYFTSSRISNGAGSNSTVKSGTWSFRLLLYIK